MSGYDIIGDVHGMATLLEERLTSLGYSAESGAYSHPERTAVFVGDLLDRGVNNCGPWSWSRRWSTPAPPRS